MMIFPAVIIAVKATINRPLEGENNLSCEARERSSDSVGIWGRWGWGWGGETQKVLQEKIMNPHLNPCLSQGLCFSAAEPPARDPGPSPLLTTLVCEPQKRLLEGNRFTAGSYLHKLAEKHLPAGYSIVSRVFFSAFVSAKRIKRKKKNLAFTPG